MIGNPTLALEEKMKAADSSVVACLDEVGRGSWAGPLCVAAVVSGTESLAGLSDSKALSPRRREALEPQILAWAKAYGFGYSNHREIDACGMTESLRRASSRALAQLVEQGWCPTGLIVDGNFDFTQTDAKAHVNVETVVKGDQKCVGVAAASVIAKVARDSLMTEISETYPQYGFQQNKGYGSEAHRQALAAFGPTTIHRRSWKFMADVPWPYFHNEATV